MRVVRAGLAGVVLFISFLVGACGPTPAPAPPAANGCYGYVSAAGEHVDQIIQRLWADDPATADWLIRTVAPRESGCDPCASYPSQHNCARVFDINHVANGPLQNLSRNTANALVSACPFILPTYSWHIADCSLQVSRWKYEAARAAGGSGREPWNG